MKTITIETADLSGAALDWAVAVALGKQPVLWDVCCGNMVGQPAECCLDPLVTVEVDMKRWEPSTDWSQGGPLVDEYKIMVGYDYEDGEWVATELNIVEWVCGPTPLIATMRAIVAAKLGDTIDVPADLVEPNK